MFGSRLSRAMSRPSGSAPEKARFNASSFVGSTSVSRWPFPGKESLNQRWIAAVMSRCGPEVVMEVNFSTPWSRPIASRAGSPVIVGFTSSPVTLRLARACGVSLISMLLDMKPGLRPWLLKPA